ncbi:hypothetical protein ATSB10_34620 [Dyella thiooxydans]|uniref:Uncharacterized protein n=1 Tax=Dyella thiooxydans TaxID=445710 RepID=A0A160N4E0_9GAMM|nr:hypothetical protein [Dyella thiooxydans]AND70916.1 hypothetical protein ATSB10_34620 [Dyella thiooxydans]
MKASWIVIAANAALLLGGCATEAKYRRQLDGWIGVPAETLVQRWGYPNGEVTAPDGDLEYIYTRRGGFTSAPTSTTNAAVGGMDYLPSTATTRNGTYVLTSCTTYFELSRDRHIANARFEGSGCKAR